MRKDMIMFIFPSKRVFTRMAFLESTFEFGMYVIQGYKNNGCSLFFLFNFNNSLNIKNQGQITKKPNAYFG